MVVTIGVSSGFVTEAPVDNPAGGFSRLTIDNRASVTHDTSSATATRITEIGWWADGSTQASNYEVGLYEDDGGVAGDLIHVSRTHAKGTTSGWKRATGLNWLIDSETEYWIGIQLDNTATITRTDINNSGATGYDYKDSQSTLPNPFNGGVLEDSNGCMAFYALWDDEAPPEGGTNAQINIGDDWKEIEGAQINIGDTWKPVEGIQINIGDTWKEVF